MISILHVIIFTMFDEKSLLLFCHILICLKSLWNILNSSIFLTFLSPMVWKIWWVFNILLVFLLSRLTWPVLFFKLLALYTPLMLTFFSQILLIFIWKQQFYQQFELFLNTLIAQIKIGMGFRSGFKSALAGLSHKHFKNYFIDILETLSFSKKLRKEFCWSPMQEMIEELKRADQSPQCLEHLENLRQAVKVRSLFRKKSQSALLQIRAQSLVLLVLYSGLFLFVLHKYGLKYIHILLLSLFLFLTGLIILFQCGRRVKWTV